MSQTARILVTGSRTWDDRETIYQALAQTWNLLAVPSEGGLIVRRSVILVHGACAAGADAMADQIWKQAGLTTEPHPADWAAHGKSAGFIRNQEMVDSGADLCLAFVKNGSKGATHCAQAADRAGIPVHWFLA